MNYYIFFNFFLKGTLTSRFNMKVFPDIFLGFNVTFILCSILEYMYMYTVSSLVICGGGGGVGGEPILRHKIIKLQAKKKETCC